MRAKMHYVLRAERHLSAATLARGLVVGFIGGLVVTIVMDLVLVGMLSAVGVPAVVSFATIGDTAAGFFALLGISMAGGVPLGAIVHYLLGLILGMLFGAAVSQAAGLRLGTIKKGIVLGIIYIEVISQPIAAMAPLILKMTSTETLQWFGASFAMHLIWGAVLGFVVSYGLRSTPTTERG